MIDGAHNNESVKVLIDLLQSEHADKEIELLFAAIDTKKELLLMRREFEKLEKTLGGIRNLSKVPSLLNTKHGT